MVRVVAAAAEALGGPIPEAQPAVAKLRRLAADCVPSSSSPLVRHAPNISGPPELLGLLALRQAPCCNPRCCNLSGASETRFKGKLCSGCRMARFCCMGCSMAAWAEHKVACKHMQRQLKAQLGREARAAAALEHRSEMSWTLLAQTQPMLLATTACPSLFCLVAGCISAVGSCGPWADVTRREGDNSE